MENTGPEVYTEPLGVAKGGLPASDDRWNKLTSLLSSLDEAPQADCLSVSPKEEAYQNELARIRLGVASSLFTALRAKHAPTAAHCIRVALGISSWTQALGLSDHQCDILEVASLLHDVGKMGVPDHILLKPGKLNGEEVLYMDRHRTIGREILRGCCLSPELLDVVFHVTARYDGTKHGFDRQGEDLPVGSRMIAIVDAFDSMTTDHVYRRALSRERAMGELYQCAGTQFDPQLVKDFCRLLGGNQLHFKAQVARRWLQDIQPETSNAFWTLPSPSPSNRPQESEFDFNSKLLDTMHDGVVFVNDNLVIVMWNRAAERLTGISGCSVLQRQWIPSLVQMRDEHGKNISDEDCPVVQAMRSGVQTLRRLTMAGRSIPRLAIDVHVAPVLSEGGSPRGATIILHDASSQITLEERVQTLHEKATRDPLTKTANRAEFERLFPEFVRTHLEQGLPCSLVICDIDHFKKINDTHGHQAGDAALGAFAAMLISQARAGDLVARYGGEEFVVLCADCDNATATQRAEEMRRRIAETRQPSLDNDCITASFGVTEIQGGDTPETFLRRADRALLQAKDSGRNLVVQLGTGIQGSQSASRRSSWLSWFQGSPGETLVERNLITVVPLNVAAEKLRGFVADHHAEILSIEDNRVTLKIDGQNTPLLRRSSDRPVPFVIEITFDDTDRSDDRNVAGVPGTLIHVVVRPKRQRDRRRRDALERARQLLVSLKSYLMAHEHDDAEEVPEESQESLSLLHRAAQALSFWQHR